MEALLHGTQPDQDPSVWEWVCMNGVT
jgi:hypothetical protein